MLEKLRFKTLFWISNGFVSILMLVVAIVVYFSISSLIETSSWVTFTYRVIEQSYVLQKSVVDMETGERGFLVTGKEEFLEPYHAGHKKFEEAFDETKKMISQDAKLVNLLENVSELAQRWDEEVAQVAIDLRKKADHAMMDADYFRDSFAKELGKASKEISDILEKLRTTTQTFANKDAEILVLSIQYDLRQLQITERDFVMNGKEEFLEDYQREQESLNAHIATLESLLAKENQESLQTFHTAKTLIENWLKEVVTPRLEARQGMSKNTVSLKDVAAFEATGKGKELVDKIRLLLTQLVDTEKALLVERNKKG